MLDVVNEDDVVIGNAPFSQVYKEQLPHRIVHVLIFNDQGDMALQKRSVLKSFCPGHWSTAVGGHVQSGESYEEAALREFQEELGTTAKLEVLRKDFYTERKKFLVTFKAIYNGPFTINPEEVEDVRFFSLEDIKNMIVHGEKFHPELLFLLKQF